MLPLTRPLLRLARTSLHTTRLSLPAARSLQVPHLLPTLLRAQQQQQQRFFRPSAPFRSDTIERRVKKIVVEQLGVSEAEVKNDASFVNDLGADSLDSVELIQALEDEFGLDIPDEESEKIQTVGQAIEYATGALKKKGRA